MEISAVKPACGCTTPGTWDKVVEPGKIGKIPVEFNSKSFGGDLKKTIQVSCNDPSQTNVTLEIKANVWRAFDISPNYTTFNFYPGLTGRQSRVVKITSNLEDPVSLSEPVCTNKNFDVVLKTLREGKEFELTISTEAPTNSLNSTAVVEMKTSSPGTPVLYITANAFVQPAISVTPSQLTLPTTPLTKAMTSKLTIRNNTTNAVTVTEPSMNAAGVDVTLNEVQPGKVFTASVDFPEGFTPPAGQKLELTLKSTLPGSESIKVPVVQIQAGPRKTAQVQTKAQPKAQAAPQSSALLRRMQSVAPTK